MIRYAFFGSSRFSVLVLDEMKKAGFLPTVIVTTPDKKQGRGLELKANPVKERALAHNIKTLDPAALDAAAVEQIKQEKCDVFIVASYGKIIPAAVLDIPVHKTLNIHPSLLPRYRGASPLQSAMLDDTKQTGVTIMRIDEKMDHGPIVAQKEVSMNEWPTYEAFEVMMAETGARLLSEILPKWVAGEILEREQDHGQATYTKKTVKEDGLIDLDAADQYANFRKIQAYHEWPTAYFFTERRGKKIRVKIVAASFKDGKLSIERIIPEGSKEMAYVDFLKGL